MAPQPVAMQPVIPNIPWDWESPGLGRLSRDQFEFCDHMPGSNDPTANFRSSSKSFSQNYFGFLDILNPQSPLEDLILKARKAATFPTGKPTYGNIPRGWTTVLDAGGILRWQPIWDADLTPDEFISQIAGQEIENVPLVVNDPSLLDQTLKQGLLEFSDNQPSGSNSQIKAGPGDIKEITVSAQAWTRVEIFPGAWFNSAILTLGRNGPFTGAFSSADLFGPNGLLSARISEIIVADTPSAEITVSREFVDTNKDFIARLTRLQVLGIDINAESETVSGSGIKILSQGNNRILKLGSTSKTPSIVGVIIETFGAN